MKLTRSIARSFARYLARFLAALGAGLTLFGAQALTLTPQQAGLTLQPGASATARFDFDFGATPLEFYAVQLDLSFDAAQIGADVNAITFGFSGTAPDFSLGDFQRANHAGGATITWVIGVAPGLPSVLGSGVLSVELSNLGVIGSTPLKLDWIVSTLDEDLSASAQIDVAAAPVPEPASWMLALAGGGLLLARRSRRVS